MSKLGIVKYYSYIYKKEFYATIDDNLKIKDVNTGKIYKNTIKWINGIDNISNNIKEIEKPIVKIYNNNANFEIIQNINYKNELNELYLFLTI